MLNPKIFSKHYLFVFTFVFVITFVFVGAFYANEAPKSVMGIFYGLIFVPMFFFFKYKKAEVDLRWFNAYMFFGFVFGFLFLINETVSLNKLITWLSTGAPFVIAFNLFCIRFVQMAEAEQIKSSKD